MSVSDLFFPVEPKVKGSWHTIYLEPIVGSGERISVAVIAILESKVFRVIQAIRSELLDCLYGVQAENMQAMIKWIIDSARVEIERNGSIEAWKPPIDGVFIGVAVDAADDDIEGILRQAIRFTSSLSSLALDADRDYEEDQPKRYSERWVRNIQDEIRRKKPNLISNFSKKIKLSEANVLTSYGFLMDTYVSNFGLLIPSRMSSSINAVKARLFDLESLMKTSSLIKPDRYELVLGHPPFSDPTLTPRSADKLEENLKMISELAKSEGVNVFCADSAEMAANHIIEVAA